MSAPYHGHAEDRVASEVSDVGETLTSYDNVAVGESNMGTQIRRTIQSHATWGIPSYYRN